LTNTAHHGHNHTQNFVMAILTRKTILNEKVGYDFCQVVLLFYVKKWFHIQMN